MSHRVKDFLWSLRDNKRAQIGIMVSIIVLLGIVLVVIVVSVNKSDSDDQTDTDTINITVDESTVTGQVARRIDGVTVPAKDANLLPVAVMIENLSTVRPQSGLQAASLVYETLAEGGITRFMVIYAGNDKLSQIGPVRSARHYFVDWAEEYGAMYAHVGGSPQALSKLFANEYISYDLNQMTGEHPYYWRDASIPAPHNLFTSSDMLAFALRDKDLTTTEGDYEAWSFVAEPVETDLPTSAVRIGLPFSSSSYAVEYVYDRDSNSYLRFNGGVEHTDALTGEQISVKNVLVQKVSTSLLEEDSGRLSLETVGEGEATLFQSGTRIDGTWKKTGEGERTQFFTTSDKAMTFHPGNTWIEILSDDRTIEYN